MSRDAANSETAASAETAFPLAAALATLTGAALLIAFGKARPYFGDWPATWQLAIVTAASFLLVWGVVEFVAATLLRPRAAGAVRLGAASWAGIVALSLGGGGTILRGGRGPSVAAAFLIAAGAVLVTIGATRFVRGLGRPAGPRTGVQRATLTRPGFVSLVIAVVLLGGGYLGPSNMLMLVFALVIGPFIVNGWFSYSMIRRLSLTRTLPRQAMAGEPFAVTLSLVNRKRRQTSWVVTAADAIVRTSRPGAGARLTAETLYPSVPPGESRDATYRLRLPRRGAYRLGPVRVRSRFPLGLVERSMTVAATDELIVVPRIGRLSRNWLRDVSADESVQRQRPRRGVHQDEFEKLRSFRNGDNPRLIHWRSSARAGSLMVREYEEVRDRDLLLLVDLAADETDAASLARAELVLEFAATAATDHLRRSRNAALAVAVAGRGMTAWHGVASAAAAEPLLRALATAEPAVAPSLEALWTFAAARKTPHTAGVFVSSRRGDFPPRPASAHWLKPLSVESLETSFVPG